MIANVVDNDKRFRTMSHDPCLMLENLHYIDILSADRAAASEISMNRQAHIFMLCNMFYLKCA